MLQGRLITWADDGETQSSKMVYLYELFRPSFIEE